LVADFVMNDKCAAGTGRFLEMMARSLEISIDELGPVSLQSKENIEISSYKKNIFKKAKNY
jgi:activator of 2-hydroxyglutaryl-CoA dehydratase